MEIIYLFLTATCVENDMFIAFLVDSSWAAVTRTVCYFVVGIMWRLGRLESNKKNIEIIILEYKRKRLVDGSYFFFLNIALFEYFHLCLFTH